MGDATGGAAQDVTVLYRPVGEAELRLEVTAEFHGTSAAPPPESQG